MEKISYFVLHVVLIDVVQCNLAPLSKENVFEEFIARLRK